MASFGNVGVWSSLALLLASAACGATESKSPTAPRASAGRDSATLDGSEAAGAAAGGNGARGPTNPDYAGSAHRGGAPDDAPPVVECGDVGDPHAGCPKTRQLADAGCSAASLCDYDQCGDGCTSTFACLPNAALSGPTRVCGAGCNAPLPEEEPWQRSRTLVFAERTGTCGAISSLTLDPQKNKLGALTCEVTADEHQGCVTHRQLDCKLDSTQLMLDLRVTFRPNRGWRGEATMRAGGSAPACTSTYWVAL